MERDESILIYVIAALLILGYAIWNPYRPEGRFRVHIGWLGMFFYVCAVIARLWR